MAGMPTEEALGRVHSGWRGVVEAHPGMLAFSGMLVLLSAYALGAGSVGRIDALLDPNGPLGLTPSFRMNLVILAVLAHTFWATVWEPRSATEHLREMRPLVALSDGDFAALARRRLTKPDHAVSGAIFGAGVVLVANRLTHGAWSGWPYDIHFLWSLPLTTALFTLLGYNGVRAVRVARLFSELGQHHIQFRLLEPGALQPFARRGLAGARVWFIGSAIAVLLLFDSTTPVLVGLIIVATMVVGIVSLLLPCLGIHREMRRCKQAELARVRGVIEARSEALFERGAALESEPGLASALAYEMRIEGIGEWPFDTPNLVRFALFFLIPVGSWLGGAMVERLVDAALS